MSPVGGTYTTTKNVTIRLELSRRDTPLYDGRHDTGRDVTGLLGPGCGERDDDAEDLCGALGLDVEQYADGRVHANGDLWAWGSRMYGAPWETARRRAT